MVKAIPEKIEKKVKPIKPIVKPVIKSEASPAEEILVSEEVILKAGSPKFFEAIGRRKTSTARVRLYTQGHKGIEVNGKPYTEYFNLASWQKTLISPLEKLNCQDKFGVTVKVTGGGVNGQVEAIRHGISRALVKLNPYFKKRLKKSGLLTRDSRMRERKKPGLKRARKAPQWSKR